MAEVTTMPGRWRPMRAGWLALGLMFVGLGFIGAFVPLMPTTIFLILAAACFTRSSPRLEAWLLNHPRFGPTLRAWRAEGAVPRRAKIAACLGMAVGFGLFWLVVRPGLWLGLTVAVAMTVCAVFVASRPSPGGQDGV
ncbi:YbaN family protein [Brevundimonas naejangsanensis]